MERFQTFQNLHQIAALFLSVNKLVVSIDRNTIRYIQCPKRVDCCLSLPIKRWCVAWPFVTSQGHKAAIKNALVNAIVKPSKFLCRYGLVFRFFDLTARLRIKLGKFKQTTPKFHGLYKQSLFVVPRYSHLIGSRKTDAIGSSDLCYRVATLKLIL